MIEIDHLIDSIVAKRNEMPAERSLLVGISGIDASGKGYVAAEIAENLNTSNVALINVDGWLNLPHIRFDPSNPGDTFYRNGLRLDDMFERLVMPLKMNRQADVTMDFAEETTSEYRTHRFNFDAIDIILLDGIFLFKKQFVEKFDLKIWIDCPFETALKRAIARSQEGLNPEQTIRAYKTIYFPAQRLHFETDDPKRASDIVFENSEL